MAFQRIFSLGAVMVEGFRWFGVEKLQASPSVAAWCGIVIHFSITANPTASCGKAKSGGGSLNQLSSLAV